MKQVDNTAQKTEALADNILVNVLTKIGNSRRSATTLKSRKRQSNINLNKPLIGAGSCRSGRMPKVIGHKEIDDDTACDHDDLYKKESDVKPPNLIVFPDKKRPPSLVSVPKVKRRISSTLSDFLNTSRQLRRQKIGRPSGNHDFIVVDEAGPRLEDFDVPSVPMGRVLAAEEYRKEDPFEKANELLESDESKHSLKVEEMFNSENGSQKRKEPSLALLKCCGLMTEGEDVSSPPILATETVQHPGRIGGTIGNFGGEKTLGSPNGSNLRKEIFAVISDR